MAVIFQLMLVICLSGCERKTTEYQESMGIETYAASDQDHKDDQDAFAKGYNLPILQGDIDQAKKETDIGLQYGISVGEGNLLKIANSQMSGQYQTCNSIIRCSIRTQEC